MNLSVIFSVLFLSATILSFAGCGKGVVAENYQSIMPQTALSSEMPADAEMSYSGSGGFSTFHFTVKISGETMQVEERRLNDAAPQKWSVKLSAAEKSNLYREFVESKFDSVKSDEPESITLDAPSENISIYAGGKTYSVSSGANHPLSGRNLKYYQNVEVIFEYLLKKHRPVSKTDDFAYTIIRYNPETDSYIFKNAQPLELNAGEIAQINKLTKNAVENSEDKKLAKRKLKKLSEYKFQYVPAINDKGEKHVWVNAFCADFDDDWKNEIVMVMDGGNCFFNFKLNLQTSAVYEFIVNGEA